MESDEHLTVWFAHSLEGRPHSEWEPLDQHLREVADLAGRFAGEFNADDWGRLAGLWHDIGKYAQKFQAYLGTQDGADGSSVQPKDRVDHSSAGAQLANKRIKPWGRLLAYVVAGHHAGLADATGGNASLDARLRKDVEPIIAAPSDTFEVANDLGAPTLGVDVHDEKRAAFQLSLFTRMIFSCLVDADFLATERFMNPAKAAQRIAGKRQLAEMERALNVYLADLAAGATVNEVNRKRKEILTDCRAAADQEPGLFSLTVPTGGGKTLASLAFALKHARHHGLNRVIYAIPFTSVVEQTADVFREVFKNVGNDVVVEHHSNVDAVASHETSRSRLAAENWDAPLVVTTNVQLFESLFAARPSQCRKLHNLVSSVIVLDEAQTLPVDLLRPCLAVLRELTADYGCSIVICTATQPALGYRDEFPIGLIGIREIVRQPAQLYRHMKRVNVRTLGPLSDDDLVDQLKREQSFLTIVNTRSHAARLYDAIQNKSGDTDGLIYLSTYLCGSHRAERIAEIRQRLAAGAPCRVVSTQLIEAGVDVDFPVVYRALTGIDSIAQAAGRCNREGKMDTATVWVFEPTGIELRGYLASVASSAREVTPDYDDLLDPAAVTQYFKLHYWKQAGDHEWDDRNVMQCFPTPLRAFAFDFRSAADRFRMIEDGTKSLFVPYGNEGERLTEKLRVDGPSRPLLRRLQRYTVAVYEQVYRQMIGRDAEELPGGYALLVNRDIYDARRGLRVDILGYHEPESLIG